MNTAWFVVFLIWTFTVPGPTTIGSTEANSPARSAKIEPGDKIVAINGQKIDNLIKYPQN